VDARSVSRPAGGAREQTPQVNGAPVEVLVVERAERPIGD
jgi:hypothetical protein